MPEQTIKLLAEQLDAAQKMLEELRLKTGWKATPKSKKSSNRRETLALPAALKIIESRKMRSRHFGNCDIFGEPAWDILLDLFIHQVRNEQVSVKSASIGSGAPASTALRWLKTLERQGLLHSEEDPTDHRRRFVSLTPDGYAKMLNYLTDVARG